MEPTAEQRTAIETDGQALVVEAGAGTGKTWVLVQRFLHLLAKHPDWPLSSIVAITFTEKATREMRSRIRTAIEKAAEDEARDGLQDGVRDGLQGGVRDGVQHGFQGGAHDGVQDAARIGVGDSLWQSRRMELEELRVSTIHGLCATVLRQNAITAGIDPQFAVLDEQETDLLKEEAIRQTLTSLADQDDPSLALLAAVQVWDLQNELEGLLNKRGTVQELFDELPDGPALVEKWRAGLDALRAEVWLEQLRQVPDLEEALRLLPELTIIDPTDGLAGAVRLAQEGVNLLNNNDLVGAVTTWTQIKRTGGKAASWGGAAARDELKMLLLSFQVAAKALTKAGATREIGADDEAAAEWLQLWKRIWQALCEIYDHLKDERHGMDFDDLEMRAETLLSNHPRSRRLQDFIAGIQHLMVDEFQDTNRRQQRIVYALAHPRDGGRLFVVGDAKQSIYRFRQAQVAVFNNTADDVQEATGQPPAQLSRSFRSHRGLLDGLNALFEQILQPLGRRYEAFEARPGALSAERPAPKKQVVAPSPVEFLILPKTDASDESVGSEEGRRWEARWLASRLKSLRESGFLVWDKTNRIYRSFRYADAVLLFRATTNLPLYEEALKEADLPYLTVSGRGYYDRPEVRDLIALLTCLNYPGDDLNLAAVLRSPLFSLSDETLYRLRWHSAGNGRLAEPIPLAIALSDPPKTDQPESIIFANQVMGDLWAMAGRVDAWQLLRNALDRTGFEATLVFGDAASKGSGRQYSNVQKFLALSRDSGGANLSEFLRRIQDLQVREAREGEALGGQPEGGAVQLMSIHAAKGLEFPVVIVADLGRGRRGRFGSNRLLHDPTFGIVCMGRDEDGDWHEPVSYTWASWLDERMEEAERKRLLYVACTRAADLLILSGKVGLKKSWLHQLLSVWEINPLGEKEELLTKNGYSLRVFRPDTRPLEKPPSTPLLETTPGLVTIPALARSLESRREGKVISVTDLIKELSRKKPGRSKIPSLADPERSRLPRSYHIGRIVHRALKNWSSLSLSHHQLTELLEEYAQKEGVSEDDIEHTVTGSRIMLYNVRNSDLYAKIETAPIRHQELPFTLRTAGYIIPGIIDIIFQDQSGIWHLFDWKTEWTDPKGEVVLSDEPLQQMAIYSAAMEKVLGAVPKAALCFLNPRWIHRPISRSQLKTTRRQMFLNG